MSRRRLELVLTDNGAMQLCRADTVLWDSLSDDDFRDEFPDEFLTEGDVGEVLEYLVEAGKLTEDEADHIDVFEESFDAEELEGELDGAAEPHDDEPP